jgi:hypothetical protein
LPRIDATLAESHRRNHGLLMKSLCRALPQSPVATKMFRMFRQWAEDHEAIHSSSRRRWVALEPGQIILFVVEVWDVLRKIAEPPAADAMIGL